jgi:protein gp37
MAINFPIVWTDATWNPVTGCDKISPGCKHCYAERMAKRLKAAGNSNYKNGFELALQPQMLHEDVPVAYIQQVFDVMNRANWHQYQVLTK